jgi:hypothetical protein
LQFELFKVELFKSGSKAAKPNHEFERFSRSGCVAVAEGMKMLHFNAEK